MNWNNVLGTVDKVDSQKARTLIYAVFCEMTMVRGLMTDKEWRFFEPFVIATGGKSGRPPADRRLVLDGIFWIARTGAQWRDLHEYFGKWSLVYR